MQWIAQSEATAAQRRILVYLVDVNDGITPITGITVSAGDIKISKNGAANANHGGSWTEVGLGLYYYQFTSGEVDTLGYASFLIAQATIRTFVKEVQVVVLSPFAAISISIANIWDYLTSSITTAGSIGKLVVDNLNATISSVKAKTDNLPSDPADASDIAASFASIASTLATIASYIDTEVAAIKAKTDNLPSDPSSAGTISTSFSSIASTLATISGYIDTEVAAIKTKTDQLTFTTPNIIDASAVTIDKTGYSLSSAGIDAILDDTPSAELASLPGTTGSLRTMIQFMFQYIRLRRTVTATQEKMFKNDGTTVLGTAPVADDGTTLSKGKMV